MALIRREIGDILVDNGQITSEELEQAKAEHDKTGEPIGHVLAKLGLATESNVKNALELQYGVNYVALAKREPDPLIQKLLSEEIVRKNLAVPISQQGERITVAMVDPSDSEGLAEVKSQLTGQVKTVVCLEEDFYSFVDKAYGRKTVVAVEANGDGKPEDSGSESKEVSEPTAPSEPASESSSTSEPAAASESAGESSSASEPAAANESAAANETTAPHKRYSTTGDHEAQSKPIHQTSEIQIPSDLDKTSSEPVEPVDTATDLGEMELVKRAQEEAIVLLANQILGNAIKRHCSNIHIISGPKECLVHYRAAGTLSDDRRLPKAIAVILTARFKMMARLHVAERGVPQDGHIKVRLSAKEIVCLVSIVPSAYGENIVIWIL